MSDKFKFSEENKRDLRLDLETWQSRNFGYDWIVKAIEDNVNNRIESIIQDRGNSIQDGASAEDVIKATIMGHVDPNNVAKISGELMRVFQSETAKVVACNDEHIKSLMDNFDYETGKLESSLSTANAHRTRLIESVKKWGGAWRTCRAELKEVKLNVKV